jgi:hypothetical protein
MLKTAKADCGKPFRAEALLSAGGSLLPCRRWRSSDKIGASTRATAICLFAEPFVLECRSGRELLREDDRTDLGPLADVNPVSARKYDTRFRNANVVLSLENVLLMEVAYFEFGPAKAKLLPPLLKDPKAFVRRLGVEPREERARPLAGNAVRSAPVK